MDFSGLLYDPIYSVLGVTATVTVGGTDYSLTVLDKTAGIELGGDVDVETLVPGAVVRARELADKGLEADDLDRLEITLNSKTWTVVANRPRPSPGGEADGEYYLTLEGA